MQSSELVEHVQARAELEEDLARRMVPPALRRDGFAIGAFVSPSCAANATAQPAPSLTLLERSPLAPPPILIGFPDDALDFGGREQMRERL